MLAIVGIRCRHYTLYKSCLPTHRIAIARTLLFWFLGDFEGNANISVAIKSGSAVVSALKDITNNKSKLSVGVVASWALVGVVISWWIETLRWLEACLWFYRCKLFRWGGTCIVLYSMFEMDKIHKRQHLLSQSFVLGRCWINLPPIFPLFGI